MKNLLYVLILLLGFPVGIYLSKICKEEIVKWRWRLVALSVISLIVGIIVGLSELAYKLPIIMSLFFVIIMFLVIVWKSY
jgi:hypothetical protein